MATVLEMLQGHQEAAEEEQVTLDGSSFISQVEPLLQAIATVAQGDTAERDQLEEVLAELEAQGWHLEAAVQRLWAGERDVAVLTAGLDEQDMLLVMRIVELLAAPSHPSNDLDR